MLSLDTNDRRDNKTATRNDQISDGWAQNMVRRLMKSGHKGVRRSIAARSGQRGSPKTERGIDASSLAELVKKMSAPRALCIMVPAAFVESTIEELEKVLEAGDTIIDGGNSHYHDDIARAKRLAPKKIHYVDMGTSGGVWGLERGYCTVIGGENTPRHGIDLDQPERSLLGRGDPAPLPIRRQLRGRLSSTCTAVRRVRGTSSRWCTTASSTA